MTNEHEVPLRIEDTVNDTCPWSGKPIAADSLTLYNGAVVGFCNPDGGDKSPRAVQSFENAPQPRRVEKAGPHQCPAATESPDHVRRPIRPPLRHSLGAD